MNGLIHHVQLGPRQWEVLRLASHGHTVQETAGIMGISHNTVKEHRKKLLGHLGARNMAQAVATGIQNGLLP